MAIDRLNALRRPHGPSSETSFFKSGGGQQRIEQCKKQEGKPQLLEFGCDYFDKRKILRTTRRLVKRLEALGHTVILEPARCPLQPSN